jgi:hypothetical protein
MNLFYFTSKNGTLVPDNERLFKIYLEKNNGKKLWADFHRETGVRTDTQNKALHLYFTHLAEELNSAGYTVQLVLKEKIDLDWTPEMIKELLWRPAQIAITGKKSTTTLDKVENITQIYEHLNRHVSEKFGLFVDFPHDENKKIAGDN